MNSHPSAPLRTENLWLSDSGQNNFIQSEFHSPHQEPGGTLENGSSVFFRLLEGEMKCLESSRLRKSTPGLCFGMRRTCTHTRTLTEQSFKNMSGCKSNTWSTLCSRQELQMLRQKLLSSHDEYDMMINIYTLYQE